MILKREKPIFEKNVVGNCFNIHFLGCHYWLNNQFTLHLRRRNTQSLLLNYYSFLIGKSISNHEVFQK